MAYLAGGDDSITAVGDGANLIVGDAFSITTTGRMAAGDDTIRAGAGADLIFGDWQSLEGQASGGDDKLYGEAGTDTVHGNGGNDLLDGGADLDNLFGGQGNDTYVIDHPGDVVDESLSGSNGTDTVKSLVLSVDLTNTTTFQGEIEYITLEGTLRLNATGNELSNKITGNSASNSLDGKGGDDTIDGGEGDDKIFGSVGADLLLGGIGNDVIYGKEGSDRLTGGAGNDQFVFDVRLSELNNLDRVTDFANATGNNDVFVLSDLRFAGLAEGALPSNAFKDVIGGGPVDANDRIIYSRSSGNLYFDQDGSGSTHAMIKFAVLKNRALLSAGDFLVA